MTVSVPAFGEHTPLPDIAEVLRLWDEYVMLDNIRAHSRRVRDVTMLLASWLEPAGVHLSDQALRVGALLHDIAKTPCLDGACRHDSRGAEILRGLGYPDLAALIALHVHFPPDGPITEAALVYYADKRVRHDTVVSLDQRFAYIKQRYGTGHPERLSLIAQGRTRAFAMESRIFSLIDGHIPEDLTDDIDRNSQVP